jgi:hypothetical protein
MRFSIEQTNETLALAQQWLEQLHHLADQSHHTETSTELAQVTVMLGEAREKLESAADSLVAPGSEDDVTVEMV